MAGEQSVIEALTAAFDESKHPRNPATGRDNQESPTDGGKFKPKEGGGSASTTEPSEFWKKQDYQWPKAMRDWHTFTKEDVLAGKVPGVVADENVREGVAGHARDKAITVKADSEAAFPDGKLGTMLLSHEAGHYIANEVQREEGHMDIAEMQPYRREGGTGYKNPWSDEFSPSYTNEPGEILADAYAELLHGEMERAVEDGDLPKQALLKRMALTAKKLGLPSERTWRSKSTKVGDRYVYETVRAAAPAMSAAVFSEHVHAATRNAETALHQKLADAYAEALRAVAPAAAARFDRHAHSLAAAGGNPYHEPGGSPKGGEFAHKPGGTTLDLKPVLPPASPNGRKMTEAQVRKRAQQVADDLAKFYGGEPVVVRYEPDATAAWDTDARTLFPDNIGGQKAGPLGKQEIWFGQNVMDDARDPDFGVAEYRKIAHEAAHASVSGAKFTSGFAHDYEEGAAEILSIHYWDQRGQPFDARDAVRVDGRWTAPGRESLVHSVVYRDNVKDVMRRAASNVGWDRDKVVSEVERVMKSDSGERIKFRDTTDPKFPLPDGVDDDAVSMMEWLLGDKVTASGGLHEGAHHGLGGEAALLTSDRQRIAGLGVRFGLRLHRPSGREEVRVEDRSRLTAAGPNREFVVAETPDDLVPKDELAAEIEKRTRQIREAVVAATVAGVLTQAGISFTVGGIFSRRILDQVGARVRDAELSTRDAIRTVIDQAQAEGWTVPETAGAIQQHIMDLAPSTATQLARTDLIGTANASSIAAARMVFAGQGTVTKSWLATEDERTRPTHMEADGQVVPLDGAFNVGGARLDYPGDPSGPDGEVCNCRCTVLFHEGQSLTSSVWQALTAAFNPALHPHRPAGDEHGGEWAPKDSGWTGPTLTPDEGLVSDVEGEHWNPDSGSQPDVVAARHDMTLEEYERETALRAKEWMESAYVASRVPAPLLDEILADGRMKSQFETQSSGGTLSNEGRRQSEEAMFGYSPDLPPEQRPIYGYMKKPNRSDNWVDSYGDVELEMKHSIRNRTTFTDGDSFAQTMIPSPVNNPSHLSVDAPQAMTNPEFDTDPVRDGLGHSWYVEAQMHGGVTVDDVAAIHVPQDWEDPRGIYDYYDAEKAKTILETIAAMKARGISVDYDLGYRA